ncbi:MAG: hypothetical protein KF861_11045, partial [Planctomycetaceae bacterium]|nr:hypothetical protein [Planctomycetaceae bacterium]
IAMTEDAARYRRPVTFYNEQLMPIVGLASRATLNRARDRCIDNGWLHYKAGAKRSPGVYWVLVPAHAQKMEDTPIDEGEDSVQFLNGIRTECERNVNGIRTECERPSYLYPNPNPEESAHADGVDEEIDLLIAEWNALPVRAIRKITQKRRTVLRARLSDPEWRSEWREALAKIRVSKFCAGSTGWKADFDWFLRPDSITKILEGKYNDIYIKQPTRGPRTGPGQVFDGRELQANEVIGI